MAKVKLELQTKTDPELRELARKHQTAMVANANFPTPDPTAAVFDAALAEYTGKLDAITAMETELKSLYAGKGAARQDLEARLTSRGKYVELASGGDADKILSAGLDLQAAATPTTSLPAPQNLTATLGDNAGEVDLSCDAVPKAKSYICEYRDYSDTAAPGAWKMAKVFTRSSGTVTGLVSGAKYSFRMRALGPHDIESPWSDESVCMAA